MMQHFSPRHALIYVGPGYLQLALAVILVVLVMSWFLYRQRFTGMRWGTVLWLLAWIAGAAVTFVQGGGVGGWLYVEYSPVQFAMGLLVVFVVPFALRLYNKWTGTSLEPEEKAPGAAGVRAWLSPWNLVVAVAIALCALAYGFSFWGVLALNIALLLAYPTVRTLTASDQPAAPVPASSIASDVQTADDRERVLKLLEDGKITAEEGAELLHALGTATDPSRQVSPRMTRGRVLLLIGAGVLIVSFFLPWFTIDLNQQMHRLSRITSQWQRQTLANASGFTGGANTPRQPRLDSVPGAPGHTYVHVSAGDLSHGLGWIILLLGVASAVIPFIEVNLSDQGKKILTAAPLAVGAFLILYLMSRVFDSVSFGPPLALAGYAMIAVGWIKDLQTGAGDYRAGAPLAA